ncbi:hypothetical protein BDV11DRAFT_170423 [Aspergillus similis]
MVRIRAVQTANILTSIALAAKLGSKGPQAYSLHPGVIFSTSLSRNITGESVPILQALDKCLGNAEAWTDMTAKSNQQELRRQPTLPLHPSYHNGAYLRDCHIADPWTETVKPWETDKVEAERL